MNVSKEMAEFFHNQVLGSSSGHMAAIPNSPVLASLLAAHGVQYGNVGRFADFLRQVADKIQEPER